MSVSEPVGSETAAQTVSHQWTGENQLLSPEDIIRLLDTQDRLETTD
jgi:hypothetical protein